MSCISYPPPNCSASHLLFGRTPVGSFWPPFVGYLIKRVLAHCHFGGKNTRKLLLDWLQVGFNLFSTTTILAFWKVWIPYAMRSFSHFPQGTSSPDRSRGVEHHQNLSLAPAPRSTVGSNSLFRVRFHPSHSAAPRQVPTSKDRRGIKIVYTRYFKLLK